tara:strand:- start:8 stop:253 length:246 start_codon:yes stop_codon:yes gene_type:complete
MAKSEKLLKIISSLIENGILTSKDIKREITNDLKFKKDKLAGSLNLVTQDQFEVLKKIVEKQENIIKELQKKNKSKKAKKS